MAFGIPTEVIRPAVDAIIAAQPSSEEAMVWEVNTSTNRHIHTTTSVITAIIPTATTISDSEDTPVLLFTALSK